jgi:DNA mismatch repair protein MSH3
LELIKLFAEDRDPTNDVLRSARARRGMKRGRPSPGGGGKAGGSAAKSKSITSFFFKAPSKADADDGGGRGGVDGGTATAPSDAPDASPPTAEATPAAKRRREDDGADAVTADTRETPDVSAQKPHTDAAPSRMSAEEVLEAIGPSDPERHALFVEKLGRRFIPREGGRVYERVGIVGDDGDAGEANDADADADEDDTAGKNTRGKKSSSSKASSSVAKLTPLETQVKKCKADHPGVLLLIEVGYKFHFYGEDAEIASKVLNIFAYHPRDRLYLTASVPVPRLHIYVRRLVEAGHKVGVIRQTETAALKAAGETEGGKSGVFERRLVGLYTRSTLEAGTAIANEDTTNDDGENVAAADGRTSSYLLCVAEGPGDEGGGDGSDHGTRIGVAAIDASTGDVRHDEFVDARMRPGLEARLLRTSPTEVLVVEPVSAATSKMIDAMYGGSSSGVRVERVARCSGYEEGGAAAAVTAAVAEFTARTSSSPGGAASPGDVAGALNLPAQTTRAVAVAFDWLRQFGLDGMLLLAPTFRPMSDTGEMSLGPNVIRQLEMLRSQDGTHRGSLLWLLGDNTCTSAGARAIRRWVSHPLTDRDAIQKRLDAVEELRAESDAGGRLESVFASLAEYHGAKGKGGGDVERYLARVFHGTATPAELVIALSAVGGFAKALASEGGDLLGKTPLVKEYLAAASDPATAHKCDELLSRVDVDAARVGKATPATVLLPDPVKFPELEKTRGAIADAERALTDLLPALRQKIIDNCAGGKGKPPKKGSLQLTPRLTYTSLRQGSSQVEHLIELPDTLPGIPTSWIRVSTNKSKKVVRYHPPEVLEAAATLERSRERHSAACAAAWRGFLRDDAAGAFLELRAAVRAAAGLDALGSFAALARLDGYVKPTLLPADHPPAIRFTGGRHPTLEATLDPGAFVPNSVDLRHDGIRALVITGPNMGGKSCFIRQVALLALMSQMGSYVPAASAELTVLDGVYTRMGASDNLAMGSSTFLEEMSECSSILNEATSNSLVVSFIFFEFLMAIRMT